MRQGIVHRDSDALSWVDRWLETDGDRVLLAQLADPTRVGRSADLKIIRAHRAGIICLDRRFLDYPPIEVWNRKRFRLKHWHGYACNRCGAKEFEGAVLHAHHIVFRSRSGTNSDRNLVTLCAKCHQKEHPDHVIAQSGGERAGVGDADLQEAVDNESVGDQALPLSLPEQFDTDVYEAVRATFQSALVETRQRGGSRREFFALLLGLFGPSVGRYALRFAADEGLDVALGACAARLR